ncbi:lysostaphin resistance A-like protein [Lacticaseibacillus sp. GG6-2]
MKKSIGKIILFIAFEFGIDTIIISLLIWGLKLPPVLHLMVYKAATVVTVLVLNHVIIHQRFGFKRLSKLGLLVLILLLGLDVFARLKSPRFVSDALAVGIFAAVPEELMYRGVFFGVLYDSYQERSDHQWQRLVPLTLSAAIFGLAHLINLQTQAFLPTLMQVIQASGLALVLGAAYLRTQNLMLPFAIHFSLDFLMTLRSGYAISQDKHPSLMMTLTIFAIYVFIAWLILLRQPVQDKFANLIHNHHLVKR